jgi:hypothetical protein
MAKDKVEKNISKQVRSKTSDKTLIIEKRGGFAADEKRQPTNIQMQSKLPDPKKP